MSDCDQIRTELGAYVLGLLDDETSSRVEEHLRSCPRCRAEVEELRGTSALLRGMSAQSDADQRPPPADETLAAIGAVRRRERRRLGSAIGAAAVLGVLALALAVTLGGRTSDPLPPDGPQITLRAPSGTHAAGTVRLSSRPWGTQVDLRAVGLPVPIGPRDGYAVWLVGPDGRRVGVGTFRPAGGAAVSRVRLAGAVPLSEVTVVGISRIDDPNRTAVLRASVT